MMEIYAVKIDEYLSRDDYMKGLRYLPAYRQERIKRYINYEDAQRALISDLLIRYIISCKLKIENQDIIILRNEFGKPYLKNSDSFQFNISHSGCWVVCAVDNYPIGVDIEKIQPIDLEIAKRYFSKEEYSDLLEKPVKSRLSYFYELWTLKESYIKADGRGLSIPLYSFTFKVFDDSILFISQPRKEEYFFSQYDIDSNYKMAVCLSVNKTAAYPTIFILSNFIREIYSSLR